MYQKENVLQATAKMGQKQVVRLDVSMYKMYRVESTYNISIGYVLLLLTYI